MIRTPQERQDWHDVLVARFEQPNDVSDRHQATEGQTFVRTLGKRCPWCGRIFFGYQVEGQEREPYKVDPNPELDREGRPRGAGVRETCGNPLCAGSEDDYQFKRRQSYRSEMVATRQAAAGPAPAKTKGGKL